jgi:hypothetical protein
VEGFQLRAVPVDGEAGDDPDHFPEEVDHCADVAELGVEGLHPQVDDLQPGGFGGGPGAVGVAPAARLDRLGP